MNWTFNLKLPRRIRSRALAGCLAALVAGGPGGAFADDGDMDFSFGLFGRAVRGSGVARAIVARPDGSLRVAINQGWHFGVLALEPNGSVDESFGDDGLRMVFLESGAVYSNSVTALFERPNGKLLLVANIDDYETVALVQLTAGGDLDFDFGTDGVRRAGPSGIRNAAYGAALQSDGKVVFAGECYDCGATASGDTWIARFTEAGGLDTGFGTNGYVVFDAVEGGTDYDWANAVAIDRLGRIVVGGAARLDPDQRPYVARRLANGSVDTTFAGSDGIRTLTALTEQQVVSLAVEPATRRPVVATGERTYANAPETCAVARLTSSGALDTTFSGDGIAPLTLEEGSNLHQLRLQTDGRIVAVGSIDADLEPVEGFLMVRLLANGTLDPSYSEDGRLRIEFDLDAGGQDVAMAVTLSGGRLVAAGFAIDGGIPQVALVRTVSALIFTDGFERGSTASWLAN